MKREPCIQSCVLNECQMVKRCFAYDAEKNHLDGDVSAGCYAYLPPAESPAFIKFEHRRRLIDE